MLKIAVTGHRAKGLPRPMPDYYVALMQALVDLKPDYLYEGQADGVDLMVAGVAPLLGIPYHAAIPYRGHYQHMPTDYWRARWSSGFAEADDTNYLSSEVEYPGPWCMHKRNRFMVDNSDALLSVYNGSGRGGTASTVKYALENGLKVYNIDPSTLERNTIH